MAALGASGVWRTCAATDPSVRDSEAFLRNVEWPTSTWLLRGRGPGRGPGAGAARRANGATRRAAPRAANRNKKEGEEMWDEATRTTHGRRQIALGPLGPAMPTPRSMSAKLFKLHAHLII